MRVHIRWMIRQDMPEVLKIESRGYDLNWCEGDYLTFLRERNSIGMVAEVGDRIVGFMVYSMHRGEIVCHRMAVDDVFHRQGVARQMVAKLKRKAENTRRARVVFRVRESETVAHRFLAAMGFKAHLERDSFGHPPEDGYIFTWMIVDALGASIVGTRETENES